MENDHATQGEETRALGTRDDISGLQEDEEPTSTDPPQISIHADIAPRITFATHQCDVAVVTDLVVSNPLDSDLEDLTLHIAAEPKVIGAKTWKIDRLSSGSEFRLRDRRVPIEGGLLDALTERMRAEIFFELRQGDTVLAESRYPISALARNEWGGAQFMPELLAAFVTPNDPAVQRLLKEASQHLENAGKNGALEGYQAKSRKRSWELVSGIWAAMSVRGITYAEPPASFARQGQKFACRRWSKSKGWQPASTQRSFSRQRLSKQGSTQSSCSPGLMPLRARGCSRNPCRRSPLTTRWRFARQSPKTT